MMRIAELVQVVQQNLGPFGRPFTILIILSVGTAVIISSIGVAVYFVALPVIDILDQGIGERWTDVLLHFGRSLVIIVIYIAITGLLMELLWVGKLRKDIRSSKTIYKDLRSQHDRVARDVEEVLKIESERLELAKLLLEKQSVSEKQEEFAEEKQKRIDQLVAKYVRPSED